MQPPRRHGGQSGAAVAAKHRKVAAHAKVLAVAAADVCNEGAGLQGVNERPHLRRGTEGIG